MTEIEERILRNQRAIMSALWALVRNSLLISEIEQTKALLAKKKDEAA